MKEEYALFVHRETASAWGVSESGDDTDMIWLPKSQVTTDERPVQKNGGQLIYNFEIPDWLATKEGLA